MSWIDVLKGASKAAPVGAEVAPYPYISGFGLLTRMTRLGVLTGPEITRLGFRDRSTLDVARCTQLLQAPARTLLTATGLADTRIAEFWPLEPWSPAGLGKLFGSPHPVRYCPDCAIHGYHSTLFQLPSIDRCPWHRKRLIHNCPNCSQLLWSRFDRFGNLGVCDCGLSFFDASTASIDMWEFPTEAAESWITKYLEWARVERKRRWIATNQTGSTLATGIAALTQPPERLQPRSTVAGTHIESFADEGEDPAWGTFLGWLLLGGLPDFTHAPLPPDLHPRLAAATREAADAIPMNTPTPPQLVIPYGFEPDVTLDKNVANRPRCFIAPYCSAAEGPTWLNLSAVDPAAIEECREVLRGAVLGLKLSMPILDRSPQTLMSKALDTVIGRRHLANALAAILLQGYRQGLELILSRLAGEPLLRRKSQWRYPVVEFCRGELGLIQVSICWVSVEAPSPRRGIACVESRAAVTPEHRPTKTSRVARRAGRRIRGNSGANSLQKR